MGGVNDLLINTEVIEMEFRNFLRMNGLKQHSYIDESAVVNRHWKTIFLFIQGKELNNNSKFFPRTMTMVKRVPGLSKMFVLFSVLEPGAEISQHTGPINGMLRIHIPLIVPVGDCYLDVSGEQIRWKKGQAVIFDDSFSHRATNQTSTHRVVLLISIYNPQLSTLQRQAVVNIESMLYESEISSGWVKNNYRMQNYAT